MTTAWVPEGESLLIRLRVTPRGGRDAIDGLRQDASGASSLAVRVAAPPADGGANKAVLALIAKAAGARKSDVTLLSGAASRDKRVRVDGEPAARIAALEASINQTK